MNLTNDQQNALDSLQAFIFDDTPMLVLEGYAGTGKSTLLKTFLQQLPDLLAGYALVDPAYVPRTIFFTATTHKAVENLMQILPREQIAGLNTTASLFAMRLVQQSYKKSKLVFAGIQQVKFPKNSLIFIDEASYLDSDIMSVISDTSIAKDSKVVFIGDPAQLIPINMTRCPVFHAKLPTIKLTEVIRQSADNPLLDLVTEFREAVATKVFPPIPHGIPEIGYMDDRVTVANTLKQVFSDPDWNPSKSRILAYTNNRVTAYNDWLAEQLEGTSQLIEGCYYINNRAVNAHSSIIRASETVMVLGIATQLDYVHGIPGSWVKLVSNGSPVRDLLFAPHNYRQWAAQTKIWEKEEHHTALHTSQSWVDLRRMYSSTVNKAQGSTFDECWIDLEDIATCRNPEQRARLLYVAASRARNKITFINMPRRK